MVLEVAQLKQAVLHSFNALQDRIGTLNRASRTDPLTGLLNRRGLQQALDALQVQGIPFAILALDIDRFKSINDSHGHDVGDAAIVHIADQMRRYSRDSDILCRAGGGNSCCCCRASVPTRPARPVNACASTSPITHSNRSAPSPCRWAWLTSQLPCRRRAGIAAGRQGAVHGQEQGRNRVVVYPYAD